MTDQRVLAYESFFRAATTDEECSLVWEIARSSGEQSLAAAGFMRSTYREGEHRDR